jgi:hypothetical protein
MYDQILDTYRKAAESTMMLQQSMLRNWAQQAWPTAAFGFPTLGSNWLEQVHSAQRKWSDTVTTMLNKHREMLDAEYKQGIRIIEDAFRAGSAKDPEQFRKLTEELWKHSFDALQKVSEEQMREFQTAMKTWFETVSQTTGVKV